MSWVAPWKPLPTATISVAYAKGRRCFRKELIGSLDRDSLAAAGPGAAEETVTAALALVSRLEHGQEAHTALVLLDALEKVLPDAIPPEAKVTIWLRKGRCLASVSNFRAACEILQRALTEAETLEPPRHSLICRIENEFGNASRRFGPEESLFWLERALRSAKQVTDDDDHSLLLRVLTNLTKGRTSVGQFDQAAQEVRECLTSIDVSRADPADLDALRLAEASAALARADFARAVEAFEAAKHGPGMREPVFAFNACTVAMHGYAGLERWSSAMDAALFCSDVVERRTLQGLRALSDRERFMLYYEFDSCQSVLLSLLSSARGLSQEALADAWRLTQTRNTLSLDCLIAERRLVGGADVTACVAELRRTEAAIAAIELTGSSKHVATVQVPSEVLKAVRRTGDDGGEAVLAQALPPAAMQETPDDESARAFEMLRIFNRRHDVLQRTIRRSPAFANAADTIAQRALDVRTLRATSDHSMLQLFAFAYRPPYQPAWLNPTIRRPRLAAFYKPAGSPEVHFMASEPLGWAPVETPRDEKWPSFPTELKEPVGALIAALFAKARPPRGRPLVVVADGAFQSTCIGAARNADGTLLGDEYDIRYAVRLTDAFATARSGNDVTLRNAADILVVGGPDYGSSAGGHRARSERSVLSFFEDAAASRSGAAFGDLPGARLEAKIVAQLMKARPIIRKDATTAHVAKSRAAKIIHLATHGFFVPSFKDQAESLSLDPRLGWEFFLPPQSAKDGVLSARLSNPLHRCGMALAGANTFLNTAKPDRRFGTGLLLGADLIAMDLSELELVVLSACNTGLGVGRVGDGIIGLQQAILAAGARAFVVSIWSIPDTITCMLVEQFYCHLLKDEMTISAALTQAQRDIRNMTVEQFNHRAAGYARIEPGAVASISGNPSQQPFLHEEWWGGFRAVGDVDRRIALAH